MKVLLTRRTVVATLRIQINEHLAVEVAESPVTPGYVHLSFVPQGGFPITVSISREQLHELCDIMGSFADSVTVPDPVMLEPELAPI